MNQELAGCFEIKYVHIYATDIIADIIVNFCPSLYSKFQIRDWMKVTSASNLTNLPSADVNLSQS